jgi:hypothetical protein
MPFRVPVGERFVECDTQEEAVGLIRALGLSQDPAMEGSGEWIPGNRMPRCGTWTAVILDDFLGRLGPDQKLILRLLIAETRATADELRAAVKVDNNKALAGIISGISKQAAAMGISAREVFGIENSRKSGVLSKSFFINENLLKIAQSINFPGTSKIRP